MDKFEANPALDLASLEVSGLRGAWAVEDLDNDGDLDYVVTTSSTINQVQNFAVQSFCNFRGLIDSASNRCSCFTGFVGAPCQLTCPDADEGSIHVCLTSGDLEGSCLCNIGYSGTDLTDRMACNDCTFPSVTLAIDDAQRYLEDPNVDYTTVASLVNLQCSLCPGGGICSGRGTCAGGKYGNGSCTCDVGYKIGNDQSCSVQACPDCKTNELKTNEATTDGCAHSCNTCPTGGICYGNTIVEPERNYWKARVSDTIVYECPSDGFAWAA